MEFTEYQTLGVGGTLGLLLTILVQRVLPAVLPQKPADPARPSQPATPPVIVPATPPDLLSILLPALQPVLIDALKPFVPTALRALADALEPKKPPV